MSIETEPIKDAAAGRHPMDAVQYREYKILLQPDRFSTPEGFHDFWKVVRHTAKRLDVRIVETDDPFERLIREVLFYDTPKFDLYNNAFILRKRTFYKNGFAERDHELTIKFRHAELARAAAVDVRPTIVCKHKIKFKEELLPLKDQLGQLRSLFSHGCELVSPAIVLDRAAQDIAQVFPALEKLEMHPKTKIALVNDVAVEEVQVDPGELHFGHGYTAKASVAIWRHRAMERPLAGEFSFQCKFDRYEDIPKGPKKLSEEFYKSVQLDAREWIRLGTTKTAMVYGLGKFPLKNHE